jgi:hypothetical protein
MYKFSEERNTICPHCNKKHKICIHVYEANVKINTINSTTY